MTGHAWRKLAILALVGAMAAAGSAAFAADDRFVRVRVETANIRQGPGTDHERLWQVEENFPLKVVGRSRQWLRTEDFVGDEGWIYAPLTDGRPAVVVEVDLANVRSGPGARYPVRFKAEWGAGFHVLDRRGKWLRIEHADGDDGWIHQSVVWGGAD
jgi:SH3-like domain-containing protein